MNDELGLEVTALVAGGCQLLLPQGLGRLGGGALLLRAGERPLDVR